MAKGIVVAAPGEITQGINSDLVDDIFLNKEAELEGVIYRFAQEQKLFVEGRWLFLP